MQQENRETEDTTYTINYDMGEWTFEVKKSLLDYSLLLKHLANDVPIENNTINLLPFSFQLSEENLKRIFDYVSKYKSYDGEDEKKEDFCVSIFEEDENFLQNFGDILQTSQFLQVDCLTDVMERYITRAINDINDPTYLCETFGWRKTKIHKDLEWTTHSNDW